MAKAEVKVAREPKVKDMGRGLPGACITPYPVFGTRMLADVGTKALSGKRMES